ENMLPRSSWSRPRPRTRRWQSIAAIPRYEIAERSHARRGRQNDRVALARWPPTNQQDRLRPLQNQSHTGSWLLSSDHKSIISRNAKQAISLSLVMDENWHFVCARALDRTVTGNRDRLS